MDCAISVILPMYNRGATVLATLDSVAAQTLRPRRLVVVDDGSSDDSAARVDKWLKKHAGRGTEGSLIRQPHRGAAAARNRGFASASDCSLVAFLDSDDCWPADFIERTSAAVLACPSAVGATCDRELHCGARCGPVLQDLTSFSAKPIEWMFCHGAALASATLFRAEAIVRRGGFDETLSTGEDTALFLRLCLDGPWLHVPGRPVAFDRTLAPGGSVEGNLSHKYRDNYRRWARIYEDFIMNGSGAQAIAPRIYRRLLGHVWYRAGRELARGGSPIEARQCYRAALAWSPWGYKSWQRLAQTYLTGPRVRSFEAQPASSTVSALAG